MAQHLCFVPSLPVKLTIQEVLGIAKRGEVNHRRSQKACKPVFS